VCSEGFQRKWGFRQNNPPTSLLQADVTQQRAVVEAFLLHHISSVPPHTGG